jgi:hypothetical protein
MCLSIKAGPTQEISLPSDRFLPLFAPIRGKRILVTDQCSAKTQKYKDGDKTMTKRILMLLSAAVLALAALPGASAQSTAPTEVMFHWGTIHRVTGQALAINFELSDHFGWTTDLPVELRLEDKDGNLIYDNSITVTPGHAVSWVIAVGPDVRIASKTIEGDIYAAVGPTIRTLQPCIKVTWPPGPTSPVDSMTPTLEVMDVLTGRVLDFANNPHTIVGP